MRHVGKRHHLGACWPQLPLACVSTVLKVDLVLVLAPLTIAGMCPRCFLSEHIGNVLLHPIGLPNCNNREALKLSGLATVRFGRVLTESGCTVWTTRACGENGAEHCTH